MGSKPCRNWRKQIGRSESEEIRKMAPSSKTQSASVNRNAKQKIRRMKNTNWKLEWLKGTFSGVAQTYMELSLKITSYTKSLPKLRLKKDIQTWLIVTRSGHGHFSEYHEEFGHEETDAECVFELRRAKLHLFSCSKA